MRRVVLTLAVAFACRPASISSDNTAEQPVIAVRWDLPTHRAQSPALVPKAPELIVARAALESVIREHAFEPDNPWAIAHAMLALGPDITLKNGRNAVDTLFELWAEPAPVGSTELIAFPTKREVPGGEDIRIEPHTDLLLKALAEAGVSPGRFVTVGGKHHVVGDLYFHSLWRTWVDGDKLWTSSWNDTPWAVQGLAAWAPQDLAWTAEGGHPMSMDRLTTAVVGQLHTETQFLRDALAAGATVQKQKQGIFAYTCGGAHLIQGAAYAVGRGFGTPEDKASMQAEVPALFYRFDLELAQVDALLKERPEYQAILLSQRLKFTGHFVETTHKLAAMGIFEPTEAQRVVMARAAGELVATVVVLERLGIFERLEELEGGPQHQLYLDYVGDSCHAVRALDLATGEGTVLF